MKRVIDVVVLLVLLMSSSALYAFDNMQGSVFSEYPLVRQQAEFLHRLLYIWQDIRNVFHNALANKNETEWYTYAIAERVMQLHDLMVYDPITNDWYSNDTLWEQCAEIIHNLIVELDIYITRADLDDSIIPLYNSVCELYAFIMY